MIALAHPCGNPENAQRKVTFVEICHQMQKMIDRRDRADLFRLRLAQAMAGEKTKSADVANSQRP